MIELVFVIVILGILAAIAIPKFAATRTDAVIAKARSDIAAIRSAILNERQSRIIKGETNFISSLDNSAAANTADETIFDGNGTSSLLMYGITTKNTDGGWMKIGNNHYRFNVASKDCDFTYSESNGTFTLDSSQPAICDNLVK